MDDGRQSSLSSHTGRAVVEYERGSGSLSSGLFCPDCGQGVTNTKGGQPLPDGCGADRTFGWQCRACENTLPSNANGPDAPTFNDEMTAIKVEFRAGHERFVPVLKTSLD
jgi:hypothetical protein